MSKTQGHKKVSARLKEIFENENFKAEVSEIARIDDIKKRKELGRKLADKYSLEYKIGSPVARLFEHPALKKEKQSEFELDVCRVIDQYAKNLDFLSYLDYLDELDTIKRTEEATSWLTSDKVKLFPVHLAISPYASKRDVLDYINKNWNLIKFHLEQYDKKLPNYRQKKNSKRDEFIWKNRKLPATELAKKADEKFPGDNLTYTDVNSILYNLRKRKLSKQV